VVPIEDREIGAVQNLVEGLAERASSVQAAIQEGIKVVGRSLRDTDTVPDWQMTEVCATFGIQITAETGVIVAKASLGAAFEVTVKFCRKIQSDE